MAERPPVLIVDDEPDVASLLENILAPLRLELTTADSGEEALDLFRPGRFHLPWIQWHRYRTAVEGVKSIPKNAHNRMRTSGEL